MERTTRTIVSILGVVAVGSWNVMADLVAEARPADALITAAPVIPRYLAAQLQGRDIPVTDPRFVGWGTLSGEIVQRTCNSGYTYSVQNGQYACCNTAALTCSFALSCENSYTADFAAETVSCDDYCITGKLYWSTDDSAPYTYVGCGSSDYWVVQSTDSSGLLSFTPAGFQAAGSATAAGVTSTGAAATTSTEAAATTTDAAATSGTSTSQSVVPGTVTVQPSSSTSDAATSTSAPKKTNIAAIAAGAAVGGVFLLGLIALAVILLLKRKNRQPSNPSQPPPPVQQVYAPVNQYGPPPTDQKEAFANVAPVQGQVQDPRQSYQPTSPAPAYGYYPPPPVGASELQTQNGNLNPNQTYNNGQPGYGQQQPSPNQVYNNGQPGYEQQQPSPNQAYNTVQPGYGQQQQTYAAYDATREAVPVASPVSEVSAATTPFSAHTTPVAPGSGQQTYAYPVVAEVHGSSVQGPVEMPGGR